MAITGRPRIFWPIASIEGVYAAGDIRVKSLRQVVTAAEGNALADKLAFVLAGSDSNEQYL